LQLSIEVAGHGLLDALVKPDEAMMALKPGQAVELTVLTSDMAFFAADAAGVSLS
jgi:hypothetical protein